MTRFDVEAFIDRQQIGRTQLSVLLVCGLVCFIDGFDIFMIGKIAPAIAEGFGEPAEAMTFLFVCQQIGLAAGAFLVSPLADRFVGVIRNETERMIRLVTDLLHLSRFDSKRNLLRRQKTDVPLMLEEVVDRFSFQLRQKAITATVKVDDKTKTAWLDRDGIDQVLDNLVSNAIKYTLDGGTIDITCKTNESGQLTIAIKDTGIGIPRKDLARIFERFYRVDKARSRNMGGTGLGLSIAREIVRAHGGSIGIESEANVGTVVTVLLPIVPEGSEPT